MENLKKLHPWLTDAELEVFANLPKKEDGKTFDLESMDAEQRALYYKDRAEASTAGFNKFKTEKDTEVTTLKTELETAKKGGPENKGTRTLTEEELEAQIPGYGGLSDREKDLVKNTIAPFAKNMTALESQVAKLLDQQRFKEEFNALIADPEYKVLAKHRDAFKVFAYKDENLNTPMAVLADSYIYKNKLTTATKPKDGEEDDEEDPNETPEEKAIRLGLEDGTGGDHRHTPPKTGMTAAELTKLRTTDPRRYNRLARQKKLGKAGIE